MKILFAALLVCYASLLIEATSDKRQIVLYWGQNTARLPEKNLHHFCTTGDYDVIVIQHITKFFAGETRYPGMNLAVHCGVIKNKAYPDLFTCGGIGTAIQECHKRGIKVLIGIQGNKGPQFLTKPGEGKLFATRVWDLFLGGHNSKGLRPFDNVVMDGINLNIESGDDRYYTEMLEQFNRLMANDRNHQYLITATPACGFPIKDFKTVFKTRPEYFDALYIRHDYTQNCHPTSEEFPSNLEKWVEYIRAMNTKSFKNTKFYLSIVMSLELKFYQTSIEKLTDLYKSTLKDIPEFGGVALSDAGWDDLQLVDNKRYSAHVRELFDGPKTTAAPITKSSAGPTSTTTTTTTEAPIPRKVAALWGSNLARAETGINEESLRYFCERGYYDTIIVNTLTDDENDQNRGNLPGLNFANHCFNPMGPGYKNYLRCDAMGHDIRFCQSKGVKVLLNIGGSVRFIGFASRNESLRLARNVWKLFLGGKDQAQEENIPRTFGATVLDGINLELRLSEKSFMVDFVQEMRRIMDNQSNDKKYYITANPNCFHPNRVLHEAFTHAISAFDHLYVNFDDQSCSINQPTKFEPVFHLWYDYTLKENGPDLYIGLPADPKNTQDSLRYLQRNKIKSRLEHYLRTYKSFGGVLLNDASWDDRNLINNRRYSEDLGDVLRHKDKLKQTVAPVTVKQTTKKKRKIIFFVNGGKEGGEFGGSKDREGVNNGDGNDNTNVDSTQTSVSGGGSSKHFTVVGGSGSISPNLFMLCMLMILSLVVYHVRL